MDRVSRIMGGGAVSDLMSSVFYEVRLPPHTQLIAAGDTVDAIYLIAQGEVEIYQQLLLEEVEGAASASPCQLPSQVGPVTNNRGEDCQHLSCSKQQLGASGCQAICV
ncbi:uncharacterized protein HaLaN_00638 [Haematococcus lacustris]|uniref:Cyclic nucleotide-binding domain-containing protein n=1 Tax=Haematococcus lacustris TaxID=44745 RepID=A0A699Y768_HAELA|nr:uncharacterized protein HaLaN_00638 [Haematococcus lacustris]